MVFNSTFTSSKIHKDYQVILLLLFLVFNYNYSESWIFSPPETINTQKATVTKKDWKGLFKHLWKDLGVLPWGTSKKQLVATKHSCQVTK